MTAATDAVSESAPSSRTRTAAKVLLGDGRSTQPELVGGVLTAYASAFAAKGTRLWSPYGPCVVCHSMKTAKRLGGLGPHPGRVTSVCAGMKRVECAEPLATGCEMGELRLWDSSTGSCMATKKFGSPIQAVRWPNAATILVLLGGPDEGTTLERVDVASGMAKAENAGNVPLHIGGVGPFDAAGDMAVLCEGKAINVWKEGWQERKLFESKNKITTVLVDPQGRYLATGDEKGVVFLWWGIFEAGSRPTQQRWHWHAGPVRSLAHSGPLVLSGGDEGVLCVRDVMEDTVKFIPRFPAPIIHIASSACGSRLCLSLQENSLALLSDLHTWERAKYIRGLDVPIFPTKEGGPASQAKGAALHNLPGGAVAATGSGRRVQFMDFTGNVAPHSVELDRNNMRVNGQAIERWVLRQVAFSAKGECLLTSEARRSPALEKFEEGTSVRSTVLKWWRRMPNGLYELDSIVNDPHSAEVTVVIAHPHRLHAFITASLDGSFKSWDLLTVGVGRTFAEAAVAKGEVPMADASQVTTCWQCIAHGSWRGRPVLSGCYAGDGSAIALGFHGFAVVWEHDGLSELQALPAGDATDRVTQLHSAVACGRFLLLATVRSRSRQEVYCWDLASHTVLSRIDLSPKLAGHRSVVRLAETPGAGAGLRLLAFQEQGTELHIWRLVAPAAGSSADLTFEPETSATLPDGHRFLDVVFAGVSGAVQATCCPLLCWTTSYELWHMDVAVAGRAAAPAQKALAVPDASVAAEDVDEPPAKMVASGRVLGAGALLATTAADRGLEGLKILDLPRRTTPAQQAGLVPQLMAKVISPHTPSHMLPPPAVIWENFLAVYGKPSPSAERAAQREQVLPAAQAGAPATLASRVDGRLPAWMDSATLADPSASSELVEGDFFDSFVQGSKAMVS